MLSLGSRFSDLPTRKEFEAKGYVVEIVSVIDAPSKKGKPMLRFDMKISEGEHAGKWSEYPKRLYQLYDTEENLKRLKGIFETIVGENKGVFPEEDPFAGGNFDEQRFVGCTVGCVTKWDKGYIEPHYFTAKERALAKEAIAKPEEVSGPPADTAKNFFDGM